MSNLFGLRNIIDYAVKQNMLTLACSAGRGSFLDTVELGKYSTPITIHFREWLVIGGREILFRNKQRI
jgi:hypothetical protein